MELIGGDSGAVTREESWLLLARSVGLNDIARRHAFARAGMAVADAEVAAAVAEERATTGRRIEAMATWYELSAKVRGYDDPVKAADAGAAYNLRSLMSPPRCQTCGDSGEKGSHDETGAFICSDCLRAALASPGEET